MGRRRDVALSRSSIAEAALEVLDEHGVGALTVRRIADRLDVQAPSLYNHVQSKDEILDAITELIGRQIDVTLLINPDWRAGLAAFAHSYRQAFREHPHALAAAARRPVETDAALTAYESALAALQEAGWEPDMAFQVLAGLEYLVLGSALVPFTGGFVREPGEYSDAYPALARSLAAVDPTTTDDAAFELGLTLFIDGLDAQFTARP